jgi:hypothetical protein
MTEATDTRLSRRTFVAGALTAAAGLTLGAPGLARALDLAPTASGVDLTYGAVVEALAESQLTATQREHALAAFRAWYDGSTEGTRGYVGRVFDALDRGAGGSFRAAAVSDRRRQLDDWLHPSDPFEPRANARLRAALAAREIAAAPAGGSSTPTSFDLPIGQG